MVVEVGECVCVFLRGLEVLTQIIGHSDDVLMWSLNTDYIFSFF